MLLHDSRRLTGRSLLLDCAGAILDVYRSPADDESAMAAVLRHWRQQARRLLDAVGWQDEEIRERNFSAGASLAISAPIDALYTATEINEWAWEAAAAIAAGSAPPDENTLAAAATSFRAAIARERDPALLALRDAAAVRGLPFLADDDFATVGLGAGSRTWPRGELPAPAAVDWGALHSIPVALVTGTNGKTTTVRLAAAILAAAGQSVGLTSTEHIAVRDEPLDAGDYSGPGGARILLRDPRVEVAILETARGGLLRRGLAVDQVAAAAVINIAADHLGEYGIEDLDALAEAKLLVTRGVAVDGRAILNADDPHLAARGTAGRSPVTWCSLTPPGADPLALLDLARHLAAGGDAVYLDGEAIVLARGNERRTVTTLDQVPITFGGAARHNVVNALFAVGLAAALGVPIEAMTTGLARFGSEVGPANPGRAQLLDIAGVQALLDYAHNPHGMTAVTRLAATLPAKRRLILLGQAGDRDDRALQDLARAAWAFAPDRIILKELPTMLRGRLPGEVAAVLRQELLRLGAPAGALSYAESEVAAVHQALDWAQPGDLLLLLIHQAREQTLAILEQRRSASPDRPRGR